MIYVNPTPKRAHKVTEQEVLTQVTELLVEAAHPRRIILFGSRARGDARPDSDLDLMVIEDEPFGPERSRRMEMVRLSRAVSEVPIPKDILVYTTDEFDKWKTGINHVIARAFREGKVLYERH